MALLLSGCVHSQVKGNGIRKIQNNTYSLQVEFFSILPAPLLPEKMVLNSVQKHIGRESAKFLMRNKNYQTYEVVSVIRSNIESLVAVRIEFIKK